MKDLAAGLETAFINKNIESDLAYRPRFVSNNPAEGKKVLASIEEELVRCDKFQISVAFITDAGIEPLMQTLKELRDKGIKGEILTANYLNFSEPKALKRLNELSNITLKMYDVDAAGKGFHTKGYIFRKNEVYRIIVGSSNITQYALTTNSEWNTKIVSTSQGEMAEEILTEFHELWNSDYSLEFDQFYDKYLEKYQIIKKQRDTASKETVISLEKYKLEPNDMQLGFITNLLRNVVEAGEERALLISATGTGKTYASAFAMRELGFKRVLFLVHRHHLAVQSLKSYKNVMPQGCSLGIVGGGRHEYDSDYVFATIQTLNKDEHLKKYNIDDFDCIILDEAHRSVANSYKKVMDYFTPKLWLGMTATPDKRDDGQEGRNVYELFNHQIAYEIRLQQAMEENMLCPFHYFGISDLKVIEDEDLKKKLSQDNFNLLTQDERVRHIIEQATYYGYSGERVKGLVFCSRVEVTEELSKKFNKTINPETGRYFRTIALNGSSSENERQNAFERLAMDENENSQFEPLDYIFSVDILNEGVDIVEVNQVIMLRPTQSPIIFIQQLGRGLRKADGKEFVVVLDFIGNYSNNYMIPIALSGDRSYNKDNIRRYVVEGGRTIPGASTVHFDEISRKRIFQSIDDANFSDLELIKDNYKTLKNKLGHIPKLTDFDKYGEMDVLRIFDNKSVGSYYNFLKKYETDYTIELSKDEEKVVEFISKKLANGKRIHELELLKQMLSHEDMLMKRLRETLAVEYGLHINQACKDNIINIMTNRFPTGSGKKTYDMCILLEENPKEGDCCISEQFEHMLRNPEFYRIVEELIEFGASRYKANYSERYQDTDLVLYQKYIYEDVCRLLNWEHNVVPLNIGGYKYDKKTKTFPVFINYDKDEEIADTIKFEDRFTSEGSLIAISKNGRTTNSEDVQKFLKSKESGIDVQLFVRKNKEDVISKEFYYLGRMTASGKTKEFTMENTTKSAVEIEWILETPVREDVYDYIVKG